MAMRMAFFCVEPPTVGSAVQVLFQLPKRSLVCFFRSAGIVVIEPDRQLLKSHPLTIRLADAKVTANQIQFSG
jgi:hypothetical protein